MDIPNFVKDYFASQILMRTKQYDIFNFVYNFEVLLTFKAIHWTNDQKNRHNSIKTLLFISYWIIY